MKFRILYTIYLACIYLCSVAQVPSENYVQTIERISDTQVESLSYDKMVNILSLMRYGLRDDSKYGLIDNLSYGYNGNQLIKVDDTVSGPYYAGALMGITERKRMLLNDK